jgi:2-polyprenyl-6-methoxyphenol hydroxylase-like FAD-dependent oxidoreductase
MKQTSTPKHIAILGGGTAGWMAATMLRKRWPAKQVEISVIESDSIGIIGVGEGSTPQLKAFFDTIGVTESEWMPACNATYKIGIRFNHWSSLPGGESYFHPFPSSLDKHVAQAFVYNNYLRRQGYDIQGHPDAYFVQARLADRHLAPQPLDNFPFPVHYGYHFDSHRLGQFLKEKAVQWGVTHRYATVSDVQQHPDGSIKSLVTDAGGAVDADMFIDCSGFTGLLIQKTLQVPFVSFKNNLFNDSAVVLPAGRQREIKAQTEATAMSNGWRWQIPLTNRTGNGYVYSSQYTSGDDAETELRSALGLLDSDIEARHLTMKVGQVKEHWSKNCLALGLSQGFIEPLEATALHVVQTTIELFAQCYEQGGFTRQYQAQLNRQISERFEGIRDYIVCHYKVNGRTDGQYWRDNAENTALSASLTSLLEVWQKGGDVAEEIQRQRIGHFYNPISWHCLLAGYAAYRGVVAKKPLTRDIDRFNSDSIQDFASRCATNFPRHEAQLELLVSTKNSQYKSEGLN